MHASLGLQNNLPGCTWMQRLRETDAPIPATKNPLSRKRQRDMHISLATTRWLRRGVPGPPFLSCAVPRIGLGALQVVSSQ